MRDHLGSIREMFTGGGTVVARYDYDPYGRSTTVLGTTPTDFNFTGLYRHSKSNLDLAVFRAYDSDLGRWLSRDPIGEKGGLNLYRYCGNRPVRSTDILGLCFVGNRATETRVYPIWDPLFEGLMPVEGAWIPMIRLIVWYDCDQDYKCIADTKCSGSTEGKWVKD